MSAKKSAEESSNEARNSGSQVSITATAAAAAAAPAGQRFNGLSAGIAGARNEWLQIYNNNNKNVLCVTLGARRSALVVRYKSHIAWLWNAEVGCFRFLSIFNSKPADVHISIVPGRLMS